MAASDVAICSYALQRLGEPIITALDENTPRAKACQTLYADMRRRLISTLSPAFAQARASLIEELPAPAFEWAKRFALPTDLLRVIEVYQPAGAWKREGQYILSNDSNLNLIYLRDIPNVGEWEGAFEDAMVTGLAADLALSLAKSESVSQLLRGEHERAKAMCASFEGANMHLIPASLGSDWAESRHYVAAYG